MDPQHPLHNPFAGALVTASVGVAAPRPPRPRSPRSRDYVAAAIAAALANQ